MDFPWRAHRLGPALLTIAALSFGPTAAMADMDADGVPDAVDNCVLIPNPEQSDADAGTDDDSSLPGIQHYGDACDADLDDDGITGASDFFGAFRPCLGSQPESRPECADADFDADGVIGPADFFSRLRAAIIAGERPGPGSEELPCRSSATARYRVTLDATWSTQTHPQQPPRRPHFSPLIGATHADAVAFWSPGALASGGIQVMAERGNEAPLATEIQTTIDAGGADVLVSGGGLALSPGQVGVEFAVSADFPLLTLVSMVAPSPDWFVGVHGLPLRLQGEWIESLTIPLLPYDAGTDSGVGFEAANQVTSPAQPISRLEGFPFLVGEFLPPLGSFEIDRIDETGCSLQDS